MSRLAATDLTLAYDQHTVATELSVRIPDQSFTVIVGPNACGKSTLLKALARVIKPTVGDVQLDGSLISSYRTKEVARRLGLLPQSPITPAGITVGDLVARGRFPHQRVLRQWSREDEVMVAEAMRLTGVLHLSDRMVDELSGGQRQRVWLALVLAQQTPLLLLDEPTTFLDMAHQLDVLDLCADLHEQRSYTIVAVLHDLNQAFRYATHLIVMRPGGRIAAEGSATEIITEELLAEVFDLDCRVIEDPESGTPLVVPNRRRRSATAMAKLGESVAS